MTFKDKPEGNVVDITLLKAARAYRDQRITIHEIGDSIAETSRKIEAIIIAGYQQAGDQFDNLGEWVAPPPKTIQVPLETGGNASETTDDGKKIVDFGSFLARRRKK